MLHFETIGDERLDHLLIAHGLFGSGRNWRVIAKRLSDQFCVTTVDMRNHAGSFRASKMSYEAMAADLAEVLAHLGRPTTVLGHSMGGKAAMMLALTAPKYAARLIIADIAPIAYGHSHMELIDAMESLDLSALSTRSDADAALAKTVSDAPVRAFLLQSLHRGEAGFEWRLNLPVLRASMAQIIDWPEPAGRYDGPTLFIAGRDSDYIAQDGRARASAYFPSARFVKLKDAGHWLHADQPKAFAKTVRAFANHA